MSRGYFVRLPIAEILALPPGSGQSNRLEHSSILAPAGRPIRPINLSIIVANKPLLAVGVRFSRLDPTLRGDSAFCPFVSTTAAFKPSFFSLLSTLPFI